MKPIVLYRVALTAAHRATGRALHVVGGEPMPRPAELRIVRYDAADEVYLFYCDASGHELTDTLHDSVERAMSQAAFEFGIRREEWIRVLS